MKKMTKKEKLEIMLMEEKRFKELITKKPREAARLAMACFQKEKKLLEKAYKINEQVIKAYNEIVPDDNYKRYMKTRKKLRKSKKWKHDQKKQGLESIKCEYCSRMHYRPDAKDFIPGVMISSANNTIYLDVLPYSPYREIYIGEEILKIVGMLIWVFWCECGNINTFTRQMFMGKENDSGRKDFGNIEKV